MVTPLSRRPRSTDKNVMKLMGLENNKAKFETIKNEMCDFCVAEMPLDMEKPVLSEYGVNLLLWEALGNFRKKYRVEMRAIGKMLDDFHKTRNFLLDWVVVCNRCDLVADRTRLHPERNLNFLELDPEFLELINGKEDETSNTTTTTDAKVKAKRPQSAPGSTEVANLVTLPQPSSQPSQLSAPTANSRLSSPPPTEIKNNLKRSISEVDLTSSEGSNTTHKIIRSVAPPTSPSPTQAPVQTGTLSPPDWKTAILRFKPVDIDTNHVRVPFRRFLHMASSPSEDVSPYDVNFNDLDKYLRRTMLAQSPDLKDTYARLVGDTAAPELWSEGELSVIFMTWESLKAVHNKREEIAVELWTSLETFAIRDA